MSTYADDPSKSAADVLAEIAIEAAATAAQAAVVAAEQANDDAFLAYVRDPANRAELVASLHAAAIAAMPPMATIPPGRGGEFALSTQEAEAHADAGTLLT